MRSAFCKDDRRSRMRSAALSVNETYRHPVIEEVKADTVIKLQCSYANLCKTGRAVARHTDSRRGLAAAYRLNSWVYVWFDFCLAVTNGYHDDVLIVCLVVASVAI